jgi:hypothetical protein
MLFLEKLHYVISQIEKVLHKKKVIKLKSKLGKDLTVTLTLWRRNFLLNFSTPVYKMRIIQEPKKVAL